MKKLLVVVDMQNDFINGSLGTSEAQAIVPKVKAKIEEYHRNKQEIIFTRDTHNIDYLKTQEGRNLPVEHCIKGTEGWQITDVLNADKMATYEHIDKPSFGFTKWNLYNALAEYDEIELVGLCTDICVISNALLLKAFYPEIKITVDARCCAGVTPTSHKNALEAMKMCQINIIGE